MRIKIKDDPPADGKNYKLPDDLHIPDSLKPHRELSWSEIEMMRQDADSYTYEKALKLIKEENKHG